MPKHFALLLSFFFVGFSLIVHAQKLPDKQKISLRAPADIKIDGKATEWSNQFQAYNHATDIFYIMTNDDDNLYLTIQAKTQEVINKIVGGGITLAIQKSGKKNNVSITYPAFNGHNGPGFRLRNHRGVIADTSAKAADSTMISNNKILEKNCKWIRVTGIEGLDTLISVYNNDGIKAAGLFNSKKIYTYELAVALKHLGFSKNVAVKFSYHITLNGLIPEFVNYTPNPNETPTQIEFAQKMFSQMNTLSMRQSAPTDFWGAYTLAKE